MVFEERLFFRRSNASGATVVGENNRASFSMVVIEGNGEVMGERIDNGGADTETGERAGAGKIGDFF